MVHDTLSDSDRRFLAYLRGLAILVIVFGHVGGFWFYEPYTEFLHVFVPVFFFLSGAVSYYSYRRSNSVVEYLKKRVLRLLVPYYLVCTLSVAAYVAENATLPGFTVGNLLMELTIRPDRGLQGFPLGGVWFLHTLIVLSIASPVLFWLYDRAPKLLMCALCTPIGLSTVQLFGDVHHLFDLAENNLYKPIVHSTFYVLGYVYFSSDALRKKWVLAASVAGGILLSLGLVAALDLRVDYTYHAFSPDLYYVSGSLAAIAALLLLQTAILNACGRLPPAGRILDFMHRYTFPIYLLHPCAIYLTERLLGLVHPTGAFVGYGIAKFAIVLASTCVMAIPFGYLSDRLTSLSLGLLGVRKA